ncbi:hypothetical protein NDU88_004115 [Pleurodeles waltl]|uniref:Uncharacterized protein n=1 Tax=Pleurodeles waltl TaxID=8319 RepID=A0AAV7QEK1_PLEWA|nr:hypothetical protein NDU88_004115 [Pleurodeles waltl]
MYRLTGGAEKGTVGSGVTVLWTCTVLELWRSRSAVARFPLRGRSSSRVNTSTLLALKERTEDGAYAAGVRGGGFTGRTAKETVGSARGRRKRGERSLCRNEEGCATGEVNIKVATDDSSGLMEEGREEGAEPPANRAMEKVGAEARGVGMIVVGEGKTTKDQCPALGVNLESQDEQSGETPLCNVAKKQQSTTGQQQSLMMEDGEEIPRTLTEEIKKGFSLSEANQVSIKEACEILETKFDLLAKRTQVLEETEVSERRCSID